MRRTHYADAIVGQAAPGGDDEFMGGNMKSSSARRSLFSRAGVIVALVAMSGVVPLASPAGASAYYTSSSPGYDASYPQGSSTPPSNVSFAIIGVTHGRPFTTNQYAQTQWSNAVYEISTSTSTSTSTYRPSLYFNTGYALAYAKSDTGTCKNESTSQFLSSGGSKHTISALQAAWAIGCSEADWAVSVEPGTPVMWWADVETGNSWSANTALNQATILGMASEFTNAKVPIPFGIYSTPSMWASITGSNFVVPGVAGDWQAGATVNTCQSSGFTLTTATLPAPLLAVQTGTVKVGGTTYDTDVAC